MTNQISTKALRIEIKEIFPLLNTEKYCLNTLNGVLDSVKPKLFNKPVGISYLKRVIKSALKDYKVNFRTYEDLKIDSNHFVVTGWFIPEEDDDDADINPIQLNCHMKADCDVVEFDTEDRWHMFKFRIIQTLMHELIHQIQYQIRDGENIDGRLCYRSKELRKRRKEYQEYLGDYDEIQTHSHDLYMEMKQYYPGLTVDEIFSLPSTYFTPNDVTTLYSYYREFKHNKKVAPIKKLKQFTKEWHEFYANK
jgi:hypothetical protein